MCVCVCVRTKHFCISYSKSLVSNGLGFYQIWVEFRSFCFVFGLCSNSFFWEINVRQKKRNLKKKYKKPTRKARVSIIKVTQIALKVGNINFLRESACLSNSYLFWLWLRTKNRDNRQDGVMCPFSMYYLFWLQHHLWENCINYFFLVWKINDSIWKG